MNSYKKKVITYGLEIILVIVSIFVASYAWFSKSRIISSGELALKTDSHVDLLISLDGETWTTETSLNLPENFTFKNEITGDGINFYVPSLKRDDGIPITFKTATVNKDYLEFDIWFKTGGNAGIFLTKDSYILPATGTTESSLIGNTVERLSSSGNFSRDLIASSTRVAFIKNDLINETYVINNSASFVWAPNKNYEITCLNDICSADINSTSLQDYNFVDASQSGSYEVKNISNPMDTIKASLEDSSANGDQMITYINTSEDDGIEKITVRIWIEGNDRDNVTALTGGIFVMNINFTAINKQLNNSKPDVYANNNEIANYNETLEYSKDNGLNWIKYSEDSNPTFNTGDTVYVRESETSMAFSSEYKILEF